MTIDQIALRAQLAAAESSAAPSNYTASIDTAVAAIVTAYDAIAASVASINTQIATQAGYIATANGLRVQLADCYGGPAPASCEPIEPLAHDKAHAAIAAHVAAGALPQMYTWLQGG